MNGLGTTVELNLSMEKSRKSQGISYCLECDNPNISKTVKMIFTKLMSFLGNRIYRSF